MKLKKIKVIPYVHGEEERLKELLYRSKEPILIKMPEFTDKFSLDYFTKHIKERTDYCVFDKYRYVTSQSDQFKNVIAEIKNDKSYRIFGKYCKKVTSELEPHVPLWQSIPFRPRGFNKDKKISYYFGGKGSLTDLHYDREHCNNLHLCLSGKKQLLLFTEDQSDNLYKVPYIGDSIIDFSQPIEDLRRNYPKINQLRGYNAILEAGDMLFLPKNCWHYTRYLEPSSAATYVFYPKKFLQIYGFFTGFFFIGYRDFHIRYRPLFRTFSRMYTENEGWKKVLLRAIEHCSYVFLLPAISITTYIYYKISLWKK